MDIPASRRDTARNAYIAQALMENSSGKAKLMESICERENMHRALKRVEANDGAPGVMDRLVQQATVQPLVAIYDHTFSDSSFGYHPLHHR